ncbi:unnamed protein product [Acanthoscelides obtectus]|uniref:Uncharacterized protein n=1 Tax=Acanthoscelides obtectus TaxID=200917 RepID=A0A9P0PYV2_ACAOB|nr:unnamed protein product [Acanthoscelides obtectus]CAK1643948.1 hypothetical protein AOBTE_LOCUS13735 [Acanthoscelides obtectus]
MLIQTKLAKYYLCISKTTHTNFICPISLLEMFQRETKRIDR